MSGTEVRWRIFKSRLGNPCSQFQQQHSSLRLEELVDANRLAANELLNDSRRKVASLDPDYFRRRTNSFSHLNEVAVSTDQCGEFQLASPIKDDWIRRPREVMVVNAFESRQNVGKLSDQFR